MVSLRIAYDGAGFSGSQRQPHKNTVEDTLLGAFLDVDLIDGFEDLKYFKMASRTDKGVSAKENILTLSDPEKKLLKESRLTRMNNSLEKIWITGYSASEHKGPLEKEYHYFIIDHGFSMETVDELCKLFSGAHDFTNFSKYNPKKETTRDISIKAIKEGRLIKLAFIGKGFLWQMCRRIASSFISYLSGDISLEDVEGLLTRHADKRPMPAPAENLVLYELKSGLNFEPVMSGIEKMHEYYLRKHERHVLGECLCLEMFNTL